MRKVILFGNSGSGKSTLAARLRGDGLAHLDLDVLAWLPTNPPQRRPLAEAVADIEHFVNEHEQWLIEGCYADLLEATTKHANEAIFMNLSVSQCQDNARNRPWEPHKYPSKAAQDENLGMLLDWIAGYMDRDDALSYRAHRALFEGFHGNKQEYTSNADMENAV